MEWVASTLTRPRNVVYPSLLTLMRTPRLPAVDWTDSPADLNGLVRLGERRNLVSARVPSGSARALHLVGCYKISSLWKLCESMSLCYTSVMCRIWELGWGKNVTFLIGCMFTSKLSDLYTVHVETNRRTQRCMHKSVWTQKHVNTHEVRWKIKGNFITGSSKRINIRFIQSWEISW